MRVLFVCTGNTCRSPMAEALARHLAAGTPAAGAIEFLSAGVHAGDGEPASRGAVEAMKRKGLDLTRHESRRATKELLASVDRIYTMTNGHRRQLAALAPEFAAKMATLAGAKDIGDPFGASIEIYEHVAGEIEREVKRLLAELAG